MNNNGFDNNDFGKLNPEFAGFVRKILLDWYSINKRSLPWRDIQDPYKIWISEIILQQTRVSQGLEYYLRFTACFPDVVSLASAEEEDVLKCWQGLGYYSRARNMHVAAKTIVSRFGGYFPSDYLSVLSLKGVGEYTAAAIVSFAWNKPYPVVDGNVFRFLSRMFAIEAPIDTNRGKKVFFDIAGKLMDSSQAGSFNQAIMEFGALQCVPVSPNCENCPFEGCCLARINLLKTENYPVKNGKVKTQNRYHHYFHFILNGYTYLNKRKEKNIWQNLYEFPVIESTEHLSFEALQTRTDFQQLFLSADYTCCAPILMNKKHVLSHRILYADFYKIILKKEPESLSSFSKIRSEDIDDYPIHRLMELYLEQL